MMMGKRGNCRFLARVLVIISLVLRAWTHEELTPFPVERCFNITGGGFVDGGHPPLYHNNDGYQTSCDVITEGTGINFLRPWVDWRWTAPSADIKCQSNLQEMYNMTQADMCNVSNGLSFLFVGDSLTFQMYSSFSLLLGEQRPEEEHQAAQHTSLRMLVPLCNGTVLASFIRSDFLSNSTNQSVSASWRSYSKNFDVLVLNRGIHVKRTIDLLGEIKELAAWLTRDSPAQEQLVFWRSTVPGHRACERILRPLPAAYIPRTHKKYQWELVPGQNAASRYVLEEAFMSSNLNGSSLHQPRRLYFVDAEGVSNRRADRHQLKRKKRGNSDCLHYCLPGPVDDWNRVFLFKLKFTRPPQHELRTDLTDQLIPHPVYSAYHFLPPSFSDTADGGASFVGGNSIAHPTESEAKWSILHQLLKLNASRTGVGRKGQLATHKR
jgi:hypothetical protein